MNKFTLSLMTILFVLSGLMNNVLAQAPEGIIYQAEALDSRGKVLSNSNLDVKIGILQDNVSGSLVYEELHNITTSNNGMFVLVIGAGNSSYDFTAIEWGNHSHFLNVQVKETKNNVWTDMGTTQLLSVPYALHAKTAEAVTGTITETDPEFTKWDKTTGISITESQISDLDHFTNSDETDPVFQGSEAANLKATDITNLGNLSGTNTGDQDISGIAINAGAIATIETEQTTQNTAIALNTAKTGITPAQATAITDNTTAISDEVTRATNAEGANATAILDEVARATAAEGINADDIVALEAGQITQDAAIALNTAKTGITPAQATAITDNTTNIATNATAISDEEARALAAEGANAAAILDEVARATAAEGINADYIVALEAGQNTQDAAIALNTAKVGITTAEQTKLAGIADGAEVNVQADWSQTANDADDFIKNKPTIPAAADGSETKVSAGTNVTVTGSGTTDSPYVVNSTTGSSTLAIGDSYQGGIICWLDATGQHGLIAATADQSTEIQWYNGTVRYTGTTGDGLYAGAMNTAMIVATQMADNQAGNFAAKVCADYSVTVNGVTYGDWYLPSKYELNLLYLQKTAVGGFDNIYYWSSTESTFEFAVVQNFSNGNQPDGHKITPYSVRAVRAF